MKTTQTKDGRTIRVLEVAECQDLVEGRIFDSAKELNAFLKRAARAIGDDVYAPYVNMDTAWDIGAIRTDASGRSVAQAAAASAWGERMTAARERRQAETGSKWTVAQRSAHAAWGARMAAARAKKRR